MLLNMDIQVHAYLISVACFLKYIYVIPAYRGNVPEWYYNGGRKRGMDVEPKGV